ncbi:MAG: hypothetical protein ACOX4V_08275 [Anaerovoracaceae bacterium]
MGRLDGKVAFVTGAAVGNGEGIARALAREGAQVYWLMFPIKFLILSIAFRKRGIRPGAY